MRYNASLFCQLLGLVPRRRFAAIVADCQAEKHSKGLRSWEQLVAMLFCQVAQAKSLREIEAGLKTSCGKLSHLGVGKAPPRSTLSYANAKRPWQLFSGVFWLLLAELRGTAPGKKRKFRFKNKLLSLDATVIELCLGLFPWASFRQTKGAVKLHCLLDHDGYFPTFAVITEGKVADVAVARHLALPRGSIVAIDRGYTDYALFRQWTDEGVFFVTRLKRGAAYEVVEERRPPTLRHIVSDQLIRLTGQQARRRCPVILRRVVVDDPEHGRQIELLTNHLHFGASTIAAIYKDRWQIELFFKVLKQQLKVKTFVGASENALQTQLWTALIAALILKYLQWQSTHPWTLSNLVALLRWNLFTYRPLWDWLNNPFAIPAKPPDEQLLLPFLDSSR